MNCPACDAPAQRSERLIPGLLVHRCRECRTFWLDGDEAHPIGPTNDPIRDLRLRAIELDRLAVEQAIITSDWDDPRWERLS